MYFDDNGHMDKRDFLQLWKEIPEQNEQNSTLQNTMNFSAGKALISLLFVYKNKILDDICTKLQQNNIFTVARRNVEGQELLYHSIKYTNNIFILSELKMQQNSPTVTVCFNY